jgi:hypothetical protein
VRPAATAALTAATTALAATDVRFSGRRPAATAVDGPIECTSDSVAQVPAQGHEDRVLACRHCSTVVMQARLACYRPCRIVQADKERFDRSERVTPRRDRLQGPLERNEFLSLH